jgi:hypothetical protein
VSWLPGRTLTQNQATIAMTIADMVAARACPAPMTRSGCSSMAGLPSWA